MDPAEQRHRHAISCQVLSYLLKHPAAMDSVDGIRSWWLEDAGLMSRSVLEDILEELVETKWMVAVGDSATRVYALNAGEADAIATFVQSVPGERLG